MKISGFSHIKHSLIGVLRNTFLIALTASSSVFFGLEPVEPTDDVGQEIHTITLSEYEVLGWQAVSPELSYERDYLRSGATANLGESLLRVPGIYGHKRGADLLEPNIRGLFFDRIGTTVNGVIIPNASPTHTASPVSQVGSLATERVRIEKGLISVTSGPPTIGGKIHIETAPDTFSEWNSERTEDSVSGQAGIFFDFLRGGTTPHFDLGMQTGAFDFRLTGFRNDMGDYESGSGDRISSEYKDWGLSTDLGWQSNRFNQSGLSLLYRRLGSAVNFSLPLDSKNSESKTLTLNHRYSRDHGTFQGFSVYAGYSESDPYLTNEDRVFMEPPPAPRPLIFAQALAESRTGGLKTNWLFPEDSVIVSGIDIVSQRRNTLRPRQVGSIELYDHIWPDVGYENFGIYMEWSRPLTDLIDLRVGGRIDHHRREAREADKMAFNRVVRDWFILYHGAGAGITDRSDTLFSSNVILRYEKDETFSTFLGVGRTTQPPGLEESYHAFLQNLGVGWRLGNPDLNPEVKYELEWGGRWNANNFSFTWDAYTFFVKDYISSQRIGSTSVPPPAPPPPPNQPVFSYRNIDALFYGLELAAVYRPTNHLRIPVTLALAQGENRQMGKDLPEIPPIELRTAVRFDILTGFGPSWIEYGALLVGDKVNPAPENITYYADTESFHIWHLRGGLHLMNSIHLELGIENLFDQEYFEYLRPPIAAGSFKPASGNLMPGDRIPAPGRRLHLTLRYDF